MVPSSSSPCAEPTGFALRFQFLFFVFALNAESSCLLSKLLCLLPSFLLNIVSVGAMETQFFIVMTLGALVSKGGVGVESSRGSRPPFLLRLDLFKQQTPKEDPEEVAGGVGVFRSL